MAEEIISLRINKELKEKMSFHDEVNWSAVIRNLIEKKIKELAEIEKIKKQIETKEEQELLNWSVQLGRKAKDDSFKRLLSTLSQNEREKLLKSVSPEKKKKLLET